MNNGKSTFIVPGSGQKIMDSAAALYDCLAMVNYYRFGGQVARVGGGGIETIGPDELRSIPERYFDVVGAWRAGRGGDPVLKPTVMPRETAQAILACDEKRRLPEIKMVSEMPVFKADGKVQTRGFDFLSGLYVKYDGDLPRVNYVDAAKNLLGLLDDFDFVTDGDKARAIAALITPALRIGGHVDPCPMAVVEANDSQTGKGYLTKIISTIYGETPEIVAKRDGGVGSLDESLSMALAKARPFVLYDNIRGKLDSQYLEAILTAGKSFQVRLPHVGNLEIDPRRYVLLATSNSAQMTKDLVNRAYFVRLRKKPEGYPFREYPEGDLLAHVENNKALYCASVMAILYTWNAEGKKAERVPGHDFRQWAGMLNHIVQRFFKLPSVLTDHAEVKARASDPAATLVREIALGLVQSGANDRAHSASDLSEFCECNGIEHNGKPPSAMVIGRTMGKLAGDRDVFTVDGIEIEVQSSEAYRSSGQPFTRKDYFFSFHNSNNAIKRK